MTEPNATPTIPENAPLETNPPTARGRPTTTTEGAARTNNNTSRSPSANKGLKDRMSGMMDKVRSAMSPHRNVGGEHSRETANPNAPISAADEDRGRTSHHHHGTGARDTSQPKTIIATGRGGAGNMIRSKSPPTTAERALHSGRVLSVEEERAQSVERARSNDRPHPSGRGGVGNVRSPSRDPAAQAALQKLDAEERTVEARYEEQLKEHPGPIAVGRGGAGNIS